MYIITECPFCGDEHSVEVREADYFDWQNGKLAQDAFPYLNANEREMLISSVCPDCWNDMFGGEVEYDGDDYGDWDYNEDMGFDAYEGCYTYDC